MPQLGGLARAQIVSIGNGYGGRLFWYEILREDSFSDSIRKALLYIGCLGLPGAERAIRQKLSHPSSRVRATACRALGMLKDSGSAALMEELEADTSPRVRTEAKLAIAQLRASGNGNGHAPGEPASSHRPLILVSDDSAHVQDSITEILAPFNFRFAYASSLPETMEMSRRLRPAAILTDNQKGRDNRSGLRMTAMIAADDANDDTAIVMVSADLIAGAFLWEGGDSFFLKPLVPARALGETLRQLTMV